MSEVPRRSFYSYLPADSDIYVHMNLQRCPEEILAKLKEFTGDDEILDRVHDILFTVMPKDNFFAAITGDFPKIAEKMIFSRDNGFSDVPNTPGVYKQGDLYFKFPQNGILLISTALNAFLFDNSDFTPLQFDFFQNWLESYGTSFFFSGKILSNLSTGALNFSVENIFLGIKTSLSRDFLCDLSMNFPDEKTANLYLPIVHIFLSSMNAADDGFKNGFHREKNQDFTVEAEKTKLKVKNFKINQSVILPQISP